MELHPQYLRGIILNDSPKKIAKLLSLAKTFRYKRIEVLSAAEDLSATQYLLRLKEKQKDMMEDIMGFCRTETGDGFATVGQLYSAVEKKYHIQRVGEVGEDVILKGVFHNVLSILAAKGELLAETAENGERGYRNALVSAGKVA